MHESEAHYEEILYPPQNGVLTTLAACESLLYLTGGTVLHRHYFGLRYSEDLDLFVNPIRAEQPAIGLPCQRADYQDHANRSAPPAHLSARHPIYQSINQSRSGELALESFQLKSSQRFNRP